MDIFNYVMVLASVIIGLGITHLLQGLVGLLQDGGSKRIYWVHVVWIASIFEMAIFWWWWQFKLSATPTWTFGLYVFVLCYAVLIYVMCALLFPSRYSAQPDGREFFYLRRRAFFGVALAMTPLDVLDTLLKGWSHFLSLGWTYPATVVVWSTAFVIAIATRNERFHAAFAVLFLITQTAFALQSFGTVQ